MMTVTRIMPHVGLIAMLSIGCLLTEDEMESDGDAGTEGSASSTGSAATTDAESGSSSGGTSESGASSSSGDDADSSSDSGDTGEPPAGDGPGPGSDPAPDANEPGEYVCDGCPEAMIDLADAGGTSSIFTVDGLVDGHDGHGRFVVVNAAGQFHGGMLIVDESGAFEQTVPLFCGESLVKMVFTNASGTSAFVKRVTNDDCLPADVRVTLAWDETASYWGLHLVRFGGTINDLFATDCCTGNNCAIDTSNHDWGVAGDYNDNPVHDLDVSMLGGVENIYYPGAEDGLTVMVENIDVNGPLTPAGTIYVNVHDLPTRVLQIESLSPKHVLTVAAVDGASGAVEMIDTDYDCAAEWDGMCVADLP